MPYSGRSANIATACGVVLRNKVNTAAISVSPRLTSTPYTAPSLQPLAAPMPISLLYFCSALLIVCGLVGAVVPIIPGVPLMFAGMWLAAWADGYQNVGMYTLIVLGVLSLLAILLDFFASMLGAKRVGASASAVFGATAGTLVGLFFGLFGLLLGPFVGALLGELVDGGTLRKAGHVGIATWVGMLVGTLVKLAICFSMLGIFLLKFFLR